jgi:hypothetical protein
MSNHRHPLLDLLSPEAEDFLSNPPVAGTGVHQWLCSATHVSYPYLEAREQIELLHWAVTKSGRAPTPGEIEKTVAHIRSHRDRGQSSYNSAWPKVQYEKVNQLVLDGPTRNEFAATSEVRELSINPACWVDTLFTNDPLLCLSREVWTRPAGAPKPTIARRWTTQRKSKWKIDDSLSLIVPNEAIATSGLTQEGKPSWRCGAMFPHRRFLVTELDFSILSRDGSRETPWAPYIRHWATRDRSVQDACAAVLHHLKQFAPLILVLWSGSKSLHAWFRAFDAPEEPVRNFMAYAVTLGCDPVTWSKCQLVRLPAGIRTENGNRQEVIYFDPNQLEAFYQ